MTVYHADWLSGQPFSEQDTHGTTLHDATRVRTFAILPHTWPPQATHPIHTVNLDSYHGQRSNPPSAYQSTSRQVLNAPIGGGSILRLPTIPTAAQKIARRQKFGARLNTWLDGVDTDAVPSDPSPEGSSKPSNDRDTDSSCKSCGSDSSMCSSSSCSASSGQRSRQRSRGRPRRRSRSPPRGRSKAAVSSNSTQSQSHNSSSSSSASDPWLDGHRPSNTQNGKRSHSPDGTDSRAQSESSDRRNRNDKASARNSDASRRPTQFRASASPARPKAESGPSRGSKASTDKGSDEMKRSTDTSRPERRAHRAPHSSPVDHAATQRPSALCKEPKIPAVALRSTATSPQTSPRQSPSTIDSNTTPQLPSLPKRAFLVPKPPDLSEDESAVSSPSLHWQYGIPKQVKADSPLPPATASLRSGGTGTIGTVRRTMDFRRAVLQANLLPSPDYNSGTQMSPTLSQYVRKARADFADVASLPPPASSTTGTSFGSPSSISSVSRPTAVQDSRMSTSNAQGSAKGDTDYLFKIARKSSLSPASEHKKSPTTTVPREAESSSSSVLSTSTSTSHDDGSTIIQRSRLDTARRPPDIFDSSSHVTTTTSSEDGTVRPAQRQGHSVSSPNARRSADKRKHRAADSEISSSQISSDSSDGTNLGQDVLRELTGDSQNPRRRSKNSRKHVKPRSALKKTTDTVVPDTKPFFRTTVEDDSDDGTAVLPRTGDIEQVPLHNPGDPNAMSGAVIGDVPQIGSRFTPAWLVPLEWYTPRANYTDAGVTISQNPFIYWLPGAEIKEATEQVRLFSFGKKARRLAWSYHQDLEDCNQHRLKFWLLAIDKLHEICRDMGNAAANGTFRRHHAQFMLRMEDLALLVDMVAQRADRMAQYSAQAFSAAESVCNVSCPPSSQTDHDHR